MSLTHQSLKEVSLDQQTLLKHMRDDHAHTTLLGVGALKTLHAPSVTISYFNDVYSGLREYELNLKKLKYEMSA